MSVYFSQNIWCACLSFKLITKAIFHIRAQVCNCYANSNLKQILIIERIVFKFVLHIMLTAQAMMQTRSIRRYKSRQVLFIEIKTKVYYRLTFKGQILISIGVRKFLKSVAIIASLVFALCTHFSSQMVLLTWTFNKACSGTRKDIIGTLHTPKVKRERILNRGWLLT